MGSIISNGRRSLRAPMGDSGGFDDLIVGAGFAGSVLAERLAEKERELAEQQARIASERKAQVGSGERSEKVRTYNFPQGRVTDHRIKHTSHNLDGVLGGALGEFTEALAAEEKRQRLEAAASAA